MNIFVLGTGRCGTVTFSAACGHLTNYTSGHETKARMYPDDRFDYPDDHIEANNRLSWFLAHRDAAYRDRDTFFVHLTRDRDRTAQSFHRRLNNGYRSSIITAFAHAIIMRPKDWPEDEQLDVCRFYVNTVRANIAQFLRKPHMVMHLETITDEFPAFLDRIDAQGDLEGARAEWTIPNNASEVRR